VSLETRGQVPHHEVRRQRRVEEEADFAIARISGLRVQEVATVRLKIFL
jgi:hypothetical protein